jgi:DUF1365 family protein
MAMPDMERLTRELSIDLAKTEQQKEILKAEFRGEDRARRQVAWLVLLIAIVVLTTSAYV